MNQAPDPFTEAEHANAQGVKRAELANAVAAKLARRDNQPLPEGGLFDEVRRAQQELF